MKTHTAPMPWLPALALLAVLLGCSSPVTNAERGRPDPPPEPSRPTIVPVPPVEFGEVFPTRVYEDLNTGGEPRPFDLAAVVGKRPVVFYYWVAGNTRAEEMLVELQRLAGEFGTDKLAVLSIVKQRPGIETPQILERARAAGIRVPILDDPEYRLGQQLAVRTVPNISILDAEGRLRLANAGSLRQDLEYNMDVAAAVKRVAMKGEIGTYGALPRYFPVNELVGQKCPDFEAPTIADGVSRRWSQLLDPDRLNVLVFWSVDCPHCKKSLPELNDWLKQRPDGINLVTAANVPDDLALTKTRDYCRLNQFVFPTLVDRGLKIGELYRITSTPTILIIRPDGVVDSVLLSGEADVLSALEAKRRALLASRKS